MNGRGSSPARRAVVILVAVVLLMPACSHGDTGQIESLVRDHLDAFQRHDVQAFADGFSASCSVDIPKLQQAFRVALGRDIKIDVTSIDVTNLTSTSATVTANGTATISGHSIPLNGLQGQNHFNVVKENGRWKIADCPGSLQPLPGPGS